MITYTQETQSVKTSGVASVDLVGLSATATRRSAAELVKSAWQWLANRQSARTKTPRLRVVDRVGLGEKNAAVILQVDGRRFLVGVATASTTLLTELQAEPSFAAVLESTPKKSRARTTKSSVEQATTEGARL